MPSRFGSRRNWGLEIIFLALLSAFLVTPALAQNPANNPNDCVILLHGLTRSSGSMTALAQRLTEAGYRTVNLGYPSRKHPIAQLAELAIPPALAACKAGKSGQIHFVSHSLGGILVRQYLAHHTLANLGRTVMISPPSQGSEVVDKLGKMPGFHLLNGPAGGELGTGPNSVPINLGPAHFEVGIITGTGSINLILSWLIPGEDDGKVSVQRARLDGMADFMTLPHSHPFIMGKQATIDQVLYFLEHGRFLRQGDGNGRATDK